MCCGIVVCLCTARERMWLAIRCPLWKTSIVPSVKRASTVSRNNPNGINLDVIVGRDRAALPLGILVALARKPFQRRPVETGEEIAAALLELLHHLRVDLRYAVSNGVVQLGQGEEAPTAQLAEHEARDNADGGLDLGLVARAANARRKHDEAVVIGEILIGSVDPRLIARRLGDAGLDRKSVV